MLKQLKTHNPTTAARVVLGFYCAFLGQGLNSEEQGNQGGMPSFRMASGVSDSSRADPVHDVVVSPPAATEGADDGFVGSLDELLGALDELMESRDSDVDQTQAESFEAGVFDPAAAKPTAAKPTAAKPTAAKPDDVSDFVGDQNGESGIASDQPIWQGAHAETLVETQVPTLPSGFPASPRAGASTFEAGYIPEFEEVLNLSDYSPASMEYSYANNESRLPRDWVVPPEDAQGAYGGGVDGSDYAAYVDSYNYSYQPYGSDDFGRYRGSRSSYEEGAHHPDGPYGYQFGDEDPFWDGGRTYWDDGRTYYGDAGYEFGGGWPLFTRGFDPERAHLKAGPFYLQVVSAEVGVLYSDYDGPAVFAPGEEDGWLGFTSLRLRAAARIAQDFYFTLDGEIIYVFGAGGFGIRSGSGSPFATLDYRTQWGMWDVRIYDQLGTALPFSLNVGDDAYKRAGRYSFGFLGYGRGSEDYLFDPVIYNTVGIQASRLISPDWRLSLEVDHTDYFYLDSDRGDNHRSLNHFGLRYGAEEGAVPFSPYVRYDAYSYDDLDDLLHTLYVGGSGRISDSVFLQARTGYFWQTGGFDSNAHWLWDVGLRHQVSRRTTHGVRFGQDFFNSDFTDDSVVSSYVNYYINHKLSERVRLHGFAQWSTDEFITGRLIGEEYESEIYGVRLHYYLSERIDTSLGYRFEQRENSAIGDEFERQIFDVNVNARITRNTTGYLRYQFEDAEFYDEDLYMAGVRRSF